VARINRSIPLSATAAIVLGNIGIEWTHYDTVLHRSRLNRRQLSQVLNRLLQMEYIENDWRNRQLSVYRLRQPAP
jgi:hypothetical protein